jgi:hypothetical protein
MSIDPKAVKTWSAEQMFKEFSQRQDLLGQLVGALYSSIVSDEMAVIEAECLERFNCAPVWLIDKNIITASRTDATGVVHDVIKPCDVHYRGMRMSAKLDIPAKPLTCLLCLVG